MRRAARKGWYAPVNITAIGHSAISTGWPPGTRVPADDARIQRYNEFNAYADGWQQRGSKPEALTVNYARTLLRKTVSYIFNAPVGFTIPADTSAITRANAAEHQLTAWRDALGLTRLDISLAMQALIQGDAAMKITWNIERSMPSVVAVDPASITVRTSPDHPRQVEQVRHLYRAKPRQLQDQFGAKFDTATDLDKPVPTLEVWTDSLFRVLVNGQTLVNLANPYGMIPYIIIANDPLPDQFWGQSDLVDLMPVCTEINRRMSVFSQILDLSGAPITVLEGVDGTEGIRIGPGAKWELPEGARAYLLDLMQGGGAEVHMKYMDLLFRMLHDLSETPRTAFGDSGRDLSGAALEVEIQPLVQKVQRKRRQWDTALTQRADLMLRMMAHHQDMDTSGFGIPTSIWPQILPSDANAAVRNAVSRVQHGLMSRRSAMSALGEHDPDAELRQMESEPLIKGMFG